MKYQQQFLVWLGKGTTFGLRDIDCVWWVLWRFYWSLVSLIWDAWVLV